MENVQHSAIKRTLLCISHFLKLRLTGSPADIVFPISHNFPRKTSFTCTTSRLQPNGQKTLSAGFLQDFIPFNFKPLIFLNSKSQKVTISISLGGKYQCEGFPQETPVFPKVFTQVIEFQARRHGNWTPPYKACRQLLTPCPLFGMVSPLA